MSVEQVKRSKSTGLVYDDVYLKHLTGPGHPECPERLKAIMKRLEASGLLKRLVRIAPSVEPMEWIKTVHSAGYVKHVEKSCLSGQGYVDTMDSPACEESYDVALKAVSGVLSAVDAVMAGKVRNVFCAIRPPGHHALPEKAMGFCLFNNVAVAARYIQKKHKLKKILIVDWDVHHGNGTHDVFYDDPTVMYFSVHQYPHYPGSGIAAQTGSGAGKGTTINVPLAMGSCDKELEDSFKVSLFPAARKFKPDFVLISAGFDAHVADPLAGLGVTAKGFGRLTGMVMKIASESGENRIVSMLEGGYGLSGLADSVEEHVSQMMKYE
ncbi:hypothetical protein BVX94_04015 [bacterium B17]|nr:hypothetical protein BVX94_04015 [bacterium B17]